MQSYNESCSIVLHCSVKLKTHSHKQNQLALSARVQRHCSLPVRWLTRATVVKPEGSSCAVLGKLTGSARLPRETVVCRLGSFR